MLIKYRGITVGGNTGPLIITDYSAPTTDLRTDYVDKLQRDGSVLSKDFLGSTSHQFTVATNGKSLQDALDLAGSLEAAWKNSSVRASTAPVALDYSNDGGQTWSRMYGKPGKFTSLTPNVRATLGVGILELEFVQSDPRHYSATEFSTTIDGTASNVGGIIAPIVSPITTVASGEARAGILTNEGDLPSPARVRFHGPSTNPSIRTDRGYTIGYKGTLAYDQWVEINGFSNEVKLNNGVSVAGRLDRRTRLSNLNVPSGRSEWSYSATDVSGTSKAVIYFREAHTSMQ